MRHTIFKTLFLLFLSFTLLITGCGKKKTYDYRIGIDPTWYPLELPGLDSNIVAFATELLQEVSQTRKMQIGLVTMSWDNILSGLQEKKYDGIFSSMYPFVFYEKKYSFSDPFLSTGPVLVVPINSKIHSLEKLKGKEVAVMPGSVGSVILEKYPDVLQRNYDIVPDALNAILTETVDAAVIDHLIAKAYIQNLYHEQLKIATLPLNDQGLRLITLYKQSPALIKEFNKGLHKLKDNGKYDELLKKWSLDSTVKK